MGLHIHDYADEAALAGALAGHLAEACRSGISRDGRAVLALAGGRTPWPVYRLLASHDSPAGTGTPPASVMPANAGIHQQAWDWNAVTVLPTDDRCVPYEHPASNLGGLRKVFASAQGLRFEPLTVADGDPDASERHARARLGGSWRRFDAVLLGMGEDGHTASLFPGAARLPCGFDATHAACRIDPEPLPADAPFARISLTVPRLLCSRSVHLAITGTRKREVLEQAIAARDPLRHPVAAVLHAPAPRVHVHWSP